MQTEKRKEYGLTPEIKKQLRDIAKELPECVEEKRENVEVDGEWLMGQGVKEIKRNNETKPVLAGKKYMIPDPSTMSLQKVPHFDRLCNSYKKYGIKGVFLYIEKVQKHIEIMAEKYPKVFEKSGVKDGEALAGQN